ncbi:hypothetical protein J6590_019898 [Homalodisca vitripennis]|nr:hypothetical protein J6590_019898 [Homalodisca vitripennis]
MLETEGSEALLCNLCKQKGILQEDLDLNFMAGDRLTFECRGYGRIHLSGYLLPDEEDDLSGMLGDEEESEEEEEETTEWSGISSSPEKQKKEKRKKDAGGAAAKKKKLAVEVEEGDSDSDQDDESDLSEGKKCRGKTQKYNKATHQLNGRRDSAIAISTRPLDFDLCLRMGRVGIKSADENGEVDKPLQHNSKTLDLVITNIENTNVMHCSDPLVDEDSYHPALEVGIVISAPLLSNGRDIANAFEQYFSSVYTKYNVEPTAEMVLAEPSLAGVACLKLDQIGEHEVRNAIKNLKSKKTVGPDLIPQVDSVKDLGIIVDCSLSFNDHITNCISSASRMLGLIIKTRRMEDEDVEDEEDDEDDEMNDKEEDESDDEEETVVSTKEKQKQQKQEKNKTPNKQNVNTPKKTPVTNGVTPKEQKSNKKTPGGVEKSPNANTTPKQKQLLEHGVIVKEIRVGNGAPAKVGKTVSVRILLNLLDFPLSRDSIALAEQKFCQVQNCI